MKPHGTLGPGLCQVWTHRDLASHSRPHCDSSVDTPIPGPGSLRSHVPRIHNTVSGGGASHAGLPEATCTVQSPKPGGPAQPLQRAGFSGGGAAPRQSSVVKSFRPPSPPCPPPPSLLLNRLLSAGTTADTLLLLMFYNSVLSALCKAFISPSFIKTKRILVSLKTDALLVLLWVWGWL